MRPSSIALRLTLGTLLVIGGLSCADSPTGPGPEAAPTGGLVLSDSLFTAGARVTASVAVPSGFSLVPGSVKWTIAAGAASVQGLGGGQDSVAIIPSDAGALQLRAEYRVRGAITAVSTTIAGPRRRVVSEVVVQGEQAVTVAAPTLAFATTPSASYVAGAPISNLRVEIRDARGQVLPGATDTVVIALDPATAAGATLLGTLRAPAIAGVATFNGLSIRKAGSGYRLVAASAGAAGTPAVQTAIIAGAPSAAQSTIAVADSVRPAGTTSTVTIALKDEYGNPVLTGGRDAFQTTATAGTVGLFTCSAGVCTAVYSVPTAVGTPLIAATIGGAALQRSPATLRVTAGRAVKFLVTGSATQVAGASQLVTITAVDEFGNVVTDYAGDRLITFSGAQASLTGTAPTAGTGPMQSAVTLRFVNGVATATMTLYRAETPTIEVTDGTIGSSGGGGLAVTVSATTPDAGQTTYTVTETTETVGGTTVVRVTVRDQYGNVVPTAKPSDFTVTPSAGTLGSFTCTNGVCEATYTAPTTPGTPTFSAKVGTTDVPTTGTSPTSITVSPGAPDATKSTVVLRDSVMAQGTSTVATVTLRDLYGNIVTTAGTSAFAAASTVGTLGSFTCTNGVCTATVQGSALGTGAVTATIGGANIVGSPAQLRITGAAAARLKITGAATQVAGASQQITITAYDAFGNVATAYTGAKSLTFSGAAVATTGTAPTVAATPFGSATAVTFADGVATVAMRLYKTESALIAAVDGAVSAANSDRLAVTVTAGAASAAQSSLALSSNSVIVGQSVTVAVTLRDQWGNLIPTAGPTDFTGSVVSGGGSLAQPFVCANGVCTSTWTAPNTAGSAALTATIGGTAIKDAPASVSITPAPAARFRITGSATQVAGVAQTVTLTALDAFDNVVTTYTGAKSLTFSGAEAPLVGSVGPTVGGTAVGSATAITFTNGVATASMILVRATTQTISATDGTLTSTASDRLTVTVSGNATPARYRITGAATQTAGVSQPITVTAFDAFGNVSTLVGVRSLTFNGATAASTGNAPTVSATAFGSATSVTFTNGEATGLPMILYATGAVQIGAVDGSVVAAGTDRLAVTVVAAAPSAAQSTLAVSPSTVSAGQPTTVTVTLRDAFGNLVPTSTTPADLAGSVVSGGGVLAQPFTCVNGSCTATYTAPNTVGTATLTATIGGNPVKDAPATVTVVSATPAKLRITGSGTQTAGIAQTITVTALDQFGNTVTGYTGAKNLTFSGASAALAGSVGPTVATTAFGSQTALTFANGVATAAMVLVRADAAAQTIEVTDGTVSATGTDRLPVIVAAGAADASASAFEASPLAIDVTQTAVVTVRIRDAFGNPVPGATATGPGATTPGTATVALAPATGSLSGFTCGTPNATGVCTATYTPPTTVPGTNPTLTATIGSGQVPVPRTIAISAGPAAAFVVTGTTGTQLTSETQNVTITAVDIFGNTAPTVTGDQVLTFSGATQAPDGTSMPGIRIGTGTWTAFGSNTTVPFLNGVSQGASVRLVKVETARLSASATVNGVAITTPTASEFPVVVSAGVPDATASTLVLSENVVAANGSIVVTVTARDAYQNPVLTTPYPLTVAAPGVAAPAAFTLINCASGVCTYQYTAPNVVPTPPTQAFTAVVTSSSAPITGSGSEVTITGGVPTRFVVTRVTAGTGWIAGEEKTIRITAKDASGSTAITYSGAKSITFSGATAAPIGTQPTAKTVPGGVATNFGNATSITFANGFADVPVALYKAEIASLQVTDGVLTSAVGGNFTQTVTEASADALRSTLAVSASTVPAGLSITVTATLKDAYGNPITNATIPGSASVNVTGGGTLQPFSCNATGVCTANYVAPTSVAVTQPAVTITGTIGGVTIPSARNITIEAGSPRYFKLRHVTNKTTWTAGASENITVDVTDAFGNQATSFNQSVAVTFTGPAPSANGTASLIANAAIGANPSIAFSAGRATVPAVLNRDGATVLTASGSITVGGSPVDLTTPGANPPGDFRLALTVDPAAASLLDVTGSNASQTAGATQTLTVTARDAYGNVATGYTGAKQIRFSGATPITEGATTSTPQVNGVPFLTNTPVTFLNGVSTTTLTMTLFRAENALIAAEDRAPSPVVNAGAKHAVTVNTAGVSVPPSTIALRAATISANGTDTSSVIVTLKDVYGNVLTPASVEIYSVSVEGTAGSFSTLTTNPVPGRYQRVVLAPASTSGRETFGVRINGAVVGGLTAEMTYEPTNRVLCTQSQPAAQSRVSTVRVTLCASANPGDLEIVSLALDGLTDDVLQPTAAYGGARWKRIASVRQSTGSGGNKEMNLVVFARRKQAGDSAAVVFNSVDNHKWSVDMLAFESSTASVIDTVGFNAHTNAASAITVASAVDPDGTFSAVLGSLTIPSTELNSSVYYLLANSLTGNIVSPPSLTIGAGTPVALSQIVNNTAGGTSSTGYVGLLRGVSGTVNAAAWGSSATANTVLLQIRVRQ